MIDDARIGDGLAMTNDAQFKSDEPFPSTGSDAPAAAEAASPPVAAEESVKAEAPADPEAQGRAAAAFGQSRGSNPYDGRSAQGRAWFRGYDSGAQEK